MGSLIKRLFSRCRILLVASPFMTIACGDDDGGTQAQRLDVGAACANDEHCTREGQSCLAFKGGYCGVPDCASNADCPRGSACVAHDDGKNYCFLICTTKAQCNQDRPLDAEANCSSSITFTDAPSDYKACVPPSS